MRKSKDTKKNDSKKESMHLMDEDIKKKEIGYRLTLYKQYKNISIEEFSLNAGYPKETIEKVFDGQFTQDVIMGILSNLYKKFGLNINWIVTGLSKITDPYFDLESLPSMCSIINNKLDEIKSRLEQSISEALKDYPEKLNIILNTLESAIKKTKHSNKKVEC